MAIVPQGNADASSSVNATDALEGIPGAHPHYHEDSTSNDIDAYNLLYDFEASIINTLLSIDPENCADGSCPPVEIPFVIVANKVGHGYAVSLGSTESANTYSMARNLYQDIVEAVDAINKILSGQHSEVNAGYQFSETSFETTADHPGHTKGTGSSVHTEKIKVHFADIGFYTGSQVYDEELGDFVDEFISYRTVRDLYPNIQFVLPTKIKTEYVLRGLFPGDINFNVNIEELYNTIFNEEIPDIFKSEYLYFHDESPGMMLIESSQFNNLFFNNSNFIARMFNPNIPVKGAPSTAHDGVSYPALTEKFLFDEIAYTYVTNFTLRNANSLTSSGAPYISKSVKGPMYPISGVSSSTLLHEFAHAVLPGQHTWYVPRLEGIIHGEQSIGIVFPYITISDLSPNGLTSDINTNEDYGRDLYNTNIISEGHLLKPPFSYTAKNPDYDRLKRAYDTALADYEDFNDKVDSGEFSTVYNSGYVEPADLNNFYPGGEGNQITLKAVRTSLINRRYAAIANFKDVSETISGDFLSISGEEKEYVEFFINKYIPSVTNNFTNKVRFISGSVDGSDRARVEQNFHKGPDYEKALQIHYGLQSFWGGSYVLNNPPVVGSTYVDPETGLEVNVYAVKEQRYCSVFKAVPSLSARDIPGVLSGNPSWRLASTSDFDILADLPSALSFLGDYSRPWVDHEGRVDRYRLNTKTVVGAPTEYEDLPNAPSNFVETAFLVKDVDLLEDDTISTSFVVNPTNDDGTRKGPDVTSYVPFCVPNDSKQATNTFDPAWYINFNGYNDKYPAYPPNTKVTDLLNEEYCPCLYKEQTYHDGSVTAYSYTIISDGSSFEALKRLYRSSVPDIANGDGVKYYGFQLSSSTEMSAQYGKSEFPNLETFFDYIENKFNRNYEIPLEFRTKNQIYDLPNPILYRYSDPSITYLELVPATGYYGIGPSTILPNVFNFDIKELTSLIVNEQSLYEDYANSVPSEYLLTESLLEGPVYPSELRYGRHYGGQSGGGASDAIKHRVDAVQTRYNLGSSIVSDPLYNPLKKYSTDGSIYNSVLNPDQAYHRDFTGDYNPINLGHILQYEGDAVKKTLAFSKDEVKRLNYNFNANLRKNLVYRSIAEQAQAPDTTLNRTIDIGSIVTLNHERYYIYKKYSGVTVPTGEDVGQVKNRLVAINLSRAYRTDVGQIYNYTDPFNNFNYPQGHDYLSYYTSMGDRDTSAYSPYNFMATNTQIEISQALIDCGFFTGDGPDLGVVHVATGEIRKLLLQVKQVSVNASKNRIDIRYAEYDEDTGTVEIRLSGIHPKNGPYSDPLKTEDLGVAVFSDPWVSEYITNSTEFASGYSQLLIREFYATDEELTIIQQKQYLEDAFGVISDKIISFDTGGELGGCVDSSKFNFNPEATYDDNTCIDIVEGCTEAWADNFDGHANIEDGSCVATLCLNTQASGEWGSGYNSALIAQVQAYHPDAIIPADENSVLQLDQSEGPTSCQFLVERRAAIMKVVCLNYGENTAFTCNENEVIQFIKDEDSGSMSTYTANPVLDQMNLSELLNHVVLIGFKEEYKGGPQIPSDVFLESFADGETEHDLFFEGYEDETAKYPHNYSRLQRNWLKASLVLSGSTDSGNSYGNRIIRYNCIENPILPDGSGGCFLFSFEGQAGDLNYKLQGCEFPEIESKTPEDCFNEVVFEGGYILNISDLGAGFDSIPNTCKPNTAKYIVPSSMSNTSSTLSVVTKDLLPLYSVYQTTNVGVTGYSAGVLRNSQLPNHLEGQAEDFEASQVSTMLTILNPNILFTENGESYVGTYVYVIEHNVKKYYVYDSELQIESDRLYFRNEILDQGIANSEAEITANNFNEIVTEINNLTIFDTDN